ncbi:MAG: oligosaccharide flippase family protein [Chitinivibrionales bacterium]|nr:oligosaccharide flippase family protein [Chitinivibrionales bacterium]
MHVYERLARNTVSNFIFKPINIAISLIAIGVLIRVLGKEKYGILLLAGTVTGQFFAFDFGLVGGLLKFIPQFKAEGNTGKINSAICAAFMIFICLGIVVCIAISIFTYFEGTKIFKVDAQHYNSAKSILYFAALGALVLWPSKVVTTSLKAFNKFHVLNIINSIEVLFRQSIWIICSITGMKVEYIFLAGYILPLLIFFAIRAGILKASFKQLEFKFGRQLFAILKQIWQYSSWILISNLSVMLKYQADRFVVSLLLGVSNLAIYHVIQRAFVFVIEITILLKKALLPVASELYTKNSSQFQELLVRGSRMANALYAPLVGVLIILIEPLMRYWVGSEYRNYYWLMRIVLIYSLLVYTGFFLSAGARTIHTVAKFQAKFGVISAGIFITLMIVLTKIYGLYGAVLSHVFSGLITMPLGYHYILKHSNITWRQFLTQATFKGQRTTWFLLLVLAPFISVINQLSDWMFALVGFCISVAFLSFSWFWCIDSKVKGRLQGYFAIWCV